MTSLDACGLQNEQNDEENTFTLSADRTGNISPDNIHLQAAETAFPTVLGGKKCRFADRQAAVSM